MKKKRNRMCCLYFSVSNFLLKMKLLTFLILVSVVSVTANSYSQQTKFSMDIGSTSVRKVFQAVEDNSEYILLYSEKSVDVNRKVSVKVKNETVHSILNQLFEGTTNYYEIYDRQIAIMSKENPGHPSIIKSKMEVTQSKKVTGIVTSSLGESIPGVSIIVKGTTIGITTDMDGNYSLNVPINAATLVFSFIGMETQEVTIGSKTVVNVLLEQSSIGLEEVIAVGYGSVKKSDLTGAVVSVKGEKLQELPITTIEQGLQGRVAGVQIIQGSGQPGAGISIRIRGVGSFAGGTEPLYVIDGVPQINDDVRDMNGLSDLDPADIESLEILKDASSTAIYGSRGANGVILITTKSGGTGVTKITYHGYLATQQVRKRMDLMTGDEFRTYATEYYTNSSNEDRDVLDGYINEIATGPKDNTDWQDELFRTALQQNHNLSISGGTQRDKYYISLGYLGQEGVVKTTNFERLSLRTNLSNEIGGKAIIHTKLVVSRSVQNGFVPSDGTNTRNEAKSGVGAILRSVPVVNAYKENGEFGDVIPYTFSNNLSMNPLAFTQATDRKIKTNMQGSMILNIELFEGLKHETRVSGRYYLNRMDSYWPRTMAQLGSQVAQLRSTEGLAVTLDDYLMYDKQLTDKFRVNAMAGVSVESKTSKYIGVKGTGFPTDDFLTNAMQAATTQDVSQTNVVESKLFSLFGRLNLNYDEKYLLTFSVRRDGASVFSENNKYAVFPSAAFAWRIANEGFLKDNPTISNLKLRLSWGKSGNQAIKAYQSLFVGKIVNTGQGAGAGLAVGAAPNLPNENLTWETSSQFNIGLDAGFFDERLRLNLDLYKKKTTDLLATVLLPMSSGFKNILDNIGELENKGIEIALGTDILKDGDWRLTVDATFSKNINKVLKTKNDMDILSGGLNDASRTTTIVRVGEPLFSLYAIKFLGFNNEGHPEYFNKNGDKNAEGNDIIDDDDAVIVGNPQPDFLYSLNPTVWYKNFSLAASFQGVSGILINNVGLHALTTLAPTTNKLSNIRDYYPVINDQVNVRRSSRTMEDASYFRLKNIRFNYKVPVTSKYIKNMDIYASATNLLTFTKYSGFDPEVNSFNGNDLRQGVDYMSYPSAKTFTLGIKVGF